MATIQTILTDFATLSLSEKRALAQYIIKISSGTGKSDLKQYVGDERFKNGIVCPHCGSVHAVKNGHRKDGTQKYKCIDCGKYFVSTSNTIVAGTRRAMSLWERYISCMMDGLSIRETAVRVGIHPSTAFIWRHKILDALQNMLDDVVLSDVVEADETFFNISFKGNHKNSKTFKMPRPAHHRGEDVKVRGISYEKACVPCAIDRNKHSVAVVSNRGRVSAKALHGIYDGKISPTSTIVTDNMNSYKPFAKDNNLNLIQLKGAKSRKGVYNVQTVNNYHSTLKKFMRRFNGVSTKYLNNYLVWNNIINFNKHSYVDKKHGFIQFVLTTQKTALYKEIPNRNPLPFVA